MAKKSLTTDDLIKNIKRKAFIPEDDDTYNDEDLIEMMDNEIDVFLVPELLSKYEEYLVYSLNVELEDDTYEYEIPYRAVGNKLRDVFFVDNPQDNVNRQDLREMHRVDLPEIYAYSGNYNYSNSGNVGLHYYVKNNKIIILNELPSNGGSLRMDFYMQPNNLVPVKSAGKITNIDRTTGVISLSSFPANFTNLPTMGCDMVKFRSPNSILSWDVNVISVSSSTKTVTVAPASINKDLIVGDFICAPQETPYPNVPSELHSILAQLVTISIMEGLDDEQAKQSAERQLAKMEKSLNTILNDRVDGSNKKIVNRHSTLSQIGMGSRGNGFDNGN